MERINTTNLGDKAQIKRLLTEPAKNYQQPIYGSFAKPLSLK